MHENKNGIQLSKNQKDQKKSIGLTIDEYIEKYVRPTNTREIKSFLTLLVVSIGLIVIFILFSFVEKLFNINKILGYAGIGISVIIFVAAFLIPILKISKSKKFITNVSISNAKIAQKHNKKVREEIADKMIDISVETQNNCWYSDKNIASLAIARAKKDDEALKSVLSNLYNTDIKKASNKMIRDMSIQVGLTTSISQSEKIDSLIVTVTELNLIKKIVYLYGYRPNDAQMLRIYKTVLTNSLFAYGLQSASTSIANGLGKLIGGAAKEIPIISTVVGSVTDGTINATLTAIVGFQTIKYLKKEYKLQDILDGVEIEESEEFEQNLISDINKNVRNHKAEKKSA